MENFFVKTIAYCKEFPLVFWASVITVVVTSGVGVFILLYRKKHFQDSDTEINNGNSQENNQ